MISAGRNSLQLQTRISLTLFAFSALVALIVGGVGHLANEKIEEEIWLQMLDSELEFQARRLGHSNLDHSNKLSKTKLFKGDPLSSLDSVPKELRSLAIGLHDELMFNGAEVCLLVKDIGPNRYFLVFDITNLEEAEHKADLIAVLAILFVLGLVVWSSVHLGRWLTYPINDLAKRVSAFSPSEKYQPIAANYSDIEVRKIAEAIDGFFVRLGWFIKREREFISMASHEFRTPLTVIAGAEEVLSTIPDLPKGVEKPLRRIKRTVKDLSDMVSVLLLLTKEELSTGRLHEPERLDSIVSNVVETHKYLVEDKDISFKAEIVEATNVSAPQALLQILISNLVRNAIQHIVSGSVTVSLEDRELIVEDTGPGIPMELRNSINNADSSDLSAHSKGLGLYIVRRITEAYGWEFRLLNRDGGGAIASVVFHSIDKTDC